MRNALHVVYLPIKEVKPYENHARVHNSKQRRKLVSLLRKFGQVTPIIVDAANVIVDGHAVHVGLQELGYDEIAVVVARNRDPSEIRALRLALNRLPQEAGWDDGALRSEFRELLSLGFDIELTGFDAVEIDVALSIDEPGAGAVETEPAEDLEPIASPRVKRGDVYILGRHAIACGDARDADLISRLTSGRKASVIFTDPPYNVKIDGFVSGLGNTRHGEFAMASGEMTKDDFTAFLAEFIAALIPALHDGAILFVCMDWRHMGISSTPASAMVLSLRTSAFGQSRTPAWARSIARRTSWCSCSSTARPRTRTTSSLASTAGRARTFGPTAG